jgi:hypothetical protein
MIELPCAADIRCSAETIFDLIVDLGGQERWLGKSSSFRGTHEVPRSLRLLRPVLVRAFAHESRRTLLALKAHADTLD